MRKILLFALLLTGLSAGAQTQQVAAIRKAYAEAKETIAKYEKNPTDVTHCSKTEAVSNHYVNPGIGPVREVVSFYHNGLDFEGDDDIHCFPFFITRSINQRSGGSSVYEEYLFNDKRELIFYFQKKGGDEARFYWSGGKLVDKKLKGSPEIDDVIVLRYAQNFCNTLQRLLQPEGFWLD